MELDSKFTDVSIWSFRTGNVTDVHLHKGSIYQTDHDNQQETSRPKTQARLWVYDNEEEKDTTDEDQQTMEINWTQLTLTKSFKYGAYSVPKVVQ